MANLAELVVGLQRMMENARIRGDDLKYTQQQEDYEHLRYLDELLGMVQRVHSSLIEERRRFTPITADKQIPEQPIPKILQKGPAIK